MKSWSTTSNAPTVRWPAWRGCRKTSGTSTRRRSRSPPAGWWKRRRGGQKWIDQAQSLNLYVAEPSGRKLDMVYRNAWLSGLKTTYYLRSMSATNAEKSTVDRGGELNAVATGGVAGAPAPIPAACAIDDPDCEACQ